MRKTNEELETLVGKRIRIISMRGEPNYAGKEGVVESIDGIGNLHGTWGGLAVIPKTDIYELVGGNENV